MSTGTRFESKEQAQAFSDLYSSTDSTSAFVHNLPRGAVYVTMWRLGDDSPVVQAIITDSGLVRDERALVS